MERETGATGPFRELLEKARGVTPGGLHSGARRTPRGVCFDRAAGSNVYDLEGNEYVDHVCGWGTISLGHCDEQLNDAIREALDTYDVFGLGTTELEYETAKMIAERVPSADRVLFGMTGSEVVAHAIRLARAVTGRRKVIKFQGHYNGWYDAVAMNFQTEAEKLGTKDLYSDGILTAVVDETVVVPYNDLTAVEEALRDNPDEVAAMVLEPVAHNMGCVTPNDGYLQGLRDLADEHDVLLVFDEVVTGFRHDIGGVQKLTGVTPDLTTMGKAGANGYPGSILCGRAEYMEQFDLHGDDTEKRGRVMYGGTFNAHPSSVAAFRTTIELLEEREFHAHTETLCDRIVAGIRDHVADVGLQATVERYGGVWLTYFVEPPIDDWRDVLRNDTARYREYRSRMVDQGILMTEKMRRNYLTASHTEADAQATIDAAGDALRSVADR